jgi:hypothetical protein
MKKVFKIRQYPDGSLIRKEMARVDYFDSYMIEHNAGSSIESVLAKLFVFPKWILFLMNVRNLFIAKPFGLISGSNSGKVERNKPFPIIFQRENEVVMGEDDKHLYFRLSVFRKNNNIYLSTVVRYNNVWGRIYFFIIKLFHKLVVKSLLRRL